MFRLKYLDRIWAGRKGEHTKSYLLWFILFATAFIASLDLLRLALNHNIAFNITCYLCNITHLYRLFGLFKLISVVAMAILFTALIIHHYTLLVTAWQCLTDYCLQISATHGADEVECSYHGDTLAETIYRLRWEPMEYLAIAERSEQILGEVTNFSPTEVCLSRTLFNHMQAHPSGSYIHLHNHPYSMVAFSDNDLETIINTHSSQTIVIATSMVYTIKNCQALWQVDSDELSRQYIEIHSKFMELKHSQLRKKCEFSMDKDAICRILTCRALAEQYGFVFTAEKYKKSQYYRDYLALRQRKVSHLFGHPASAQK